MKEFKQDFPLRYWVPAGIFGTFTITPRDWGRQRRVFAQKKNTCRRPEGLNTPIIAGAHSNIIQTYNQKI